MTGVAPVAVAWGVVGPDGTVDVRSITVHRRGAIANWLMCNTKNHGITNDTPDKQIEERWQIAVNRLATEKRVIRVARFEIWEIREG